MSSGDLCRRMGHGSLSSSHGASPPKAPQSRRNCHTYIHQYLHGDFLFQLLGNAQYYQTAVGTAYLVFIDNTAPPTYIDLAVRLRLNAGE